jgi:nucleotide sugar dehydrogenase
VNVAVIGLGKIGLPLAVQFSKQGHQVTGVDINALAVDAVNSGRAHFAEEAHLQEYLSEQVAAGRLRAVTDYSAAIPQADVVVVVVPLFVDADGVPDFRALDEATGEIGAHLTSDTLVIYETTLPVGTTRTRWKPMNELASGLVEGRDFHLAFSPERVLTGRVFADLRRYPKLVGGLSVEGSSRAVSFYEAVLEFDERPDLERPNGVWDLGSAEAAEMAKLAETTYRDVNIGLANQFAIFAESQGIDVHAVIDACNSQVFSHIHRPGIAVGGHCIPVYPRLYLWNDDKASVVRAAREANAAMPEHVVGSLEDVHGSLAGQRVVVLGAAYRGGVKETAFSGVFPTVAALVARGAVPLVHDPLYTADELTALGLSPYGLGDTVDAAVVHTDHEDYREWTPANLPGVRTVVDGRRVLTAVDWLDVNLVFLGVGVTTG